eukprot:1125252-Prymnesium_polylepis.3
MSVVPLEISQLVESAQKTYECCMGTLPRPCSPFVLIYGPISATQLEQFMHEFNDRHETSDDTHFLLLSPRNLNAYRATMAGSDMDHRLCVCHVAAHKTPKQRNCAHTHN